MTPDESITVRVAEALEVCGIPYLLTGSFASNYYGIPRSTQDADFVVQMQTAAGQGLAQRLGEEFVLEPQLSFEINTGTLRQVLRHVEKAFAVELFLLSQDPHDVSRFQRRQAVPFLNRRVWLPTPEDVIVTKLRWARGKDKDDVRDVMAVQENNLDWRYIEGWCQQHGTLALMNLIRSSIPGS